MDGIEEFIYAVQVGTTIVGIFAGALGGESLKAELSALLVKVGLSPSVAGTLALLLVVAVITYFTLVLGELVPKRIALNDPERTASRVASARRA